MQATRESNLSLAFASIDNYFYSMQPTRARDWLNEDQLLFGPTNPSGSFDKFFAIIYLGQDYSLS